MAYELIIDATNNNIEVHYDLCDILFDKKDDFEFNNQVEYINLMNFDEISEFINKDEYKDFEIIYCESCKPIDNKDKYDEEYDDFYEEFDEDDELDDTRCDII